MRFLGVESFGCLFAALALLGGSAACSTVPVSGPMDFMHGYDPRAPGRGPQPEHSASKVPGEAIVVVNPGDSPDILSFTVENLTEAEWMFVDRDAVKLATSAGTQLRAGGGAYRSYAVAPGKMAMVNVRFSFDGLKPGERVAALFDDAVTVGGRHVGLEPLPFIVR